MIKIILLTLTVWLAIGFAIAGPPKNISVKIDREEIRDVVRAKIALERDLFDPYSAVYGTVVRRNGIVCGYVNAKNKFGAYVGMREFVWIEGHAAVINDRKAAFAKVWRTKCTGEKT